MMMDADLDRKDRMRRLPQVRYLLRQHLLRLLLMLLDHFLLFPKNNQWMLNKMLKKNLSFPQTIRRDDEPQLFHDLRR